MAGAGADVTALSRVDLANALLTAATETGGWPRKIVLQSRRSEAIRGRSRAPTTPPEPPCSQVLAIDRGRSTQQRESAGEVLLECLAGELGDSLAFSGGAHLCLGSQLGRRPERDVR